MPSVNMMPVWNSVTAQSITEGLLRQKGKLARAMKVSHAEGELRLKWSNMSVKGTPAWRPSLVRDLWPTLQHDTAYEQHVWNEDGCIYDPMFSRECSCPKCSVSGMLSDVVSL